MQDRHSQRSLGRCCLDMPLLRSKEAAEAEPVRLRDREDADELREALLAWQRRYNAQRPHQALGWKTPAEYLAEKLGLTVEEAAAWQAKP